MKFAETNCEVRRTHPALGEFYAVCKASTCTYVGPARATQAAAKRDGVRHHGSDA